MAERDFKGVWIPKEIWLAEDIGWSAKMLLVEIDSLATNGECFASNDYLGQFFGLGKDRISRLVSELKEKGYIEVELVYKVGTKQIEKRRITTMGYRRKCLQGIGENTNTPHGEKTDTPIGENTKDINTDVINTSLINTREKKPAASTPAPELNFGAELQEAYSDWLKYKAERKEKYTPTGRKSLETQLLNNVKEHGEAAVAALIRECMASGWKGIIFEKLKTQPQKYGRREMVPGWMQNDGESYRKDMERNLRSLEKSKGADPELKARIESLKQRIGSN